MSFSRCLPVADTAIYTIYTIAVIVMTMSIHLITTNLDDYLFKEINHSP